MSIRQALIILEGHKKDFYDHKRFDSSCVTSNKCWYSPDPNKVVGYTIIINHKILIQ